MSQEIQSSDELGEKRDQIVSLVKNHATELVDAYRPLMSNSYGQIRVPVETDAGEGQWVLKHDDGSPEWLRYESPRGGQTYVISTREPPTAGELAQVMSHYPDFIEGFNAKLERVESGLDEAVDAVTNAPDVRSTDTLSDRQDELAEAFRTVGDEVAAVYSEIRSKNYGKVTATVDGDTWALKFNDNGNAEWLRVGGRSGTYLISDRSTPSLGALTKYGKRLPAYVEAINEALAEEEEAAADFSLTVTTSEDA